MAAVRVLFTGSVWFTLQNFVANGQTVAQIWRFFYLSKWRPTPKSYALQWVIHSPKSAPSRGNICTSRWLPGSTLLSIPNDILIGSAVFAQIKPESPYTLQWAALFLYPFPWGCGPHLIHASLGPPEPTSADQLATSCESVCYQIRAISTYRDSSNLSATGRS